VSAVFTPSAAHYADIERAFIVCVNAYFDEAAEVNLASAVAGRNRELAIRALPDIGNPYDDRSRIVFRNMVDALVPSMARVYTASANHTAQTDKLALRYVTPVAKAAKKKKYAPTVVAVDLTWVRQKAAKRVVEIGRDQRDALRKVLESKFDETKRPAVIAKEIKKLVGLTSREAQALTNRRAELIADGVTPARVEAETKRYSEQLLTNRAQRIARTEGVDAATAGKIGAWQDARDDKLIPKDAMKEWVSSGDACDEICAKMDGERVPIDGLFRLPDGRRVDGPTAHPHCECGLVLRRGEL
jgi:hypothetical protein